MAELQKAIEILKREYENAKKQKFIRDPIAHALYKTWKAFDLRRDING